jgi:hypothetical protein
MRAPKSNRPEEATPLGPAAALPPPEGSFAAGLDEFLAYLASELVAEYLELIKSLPKQQQQQGEKK